AWRDPAGQQGSAEDSEGRRRKEPAEELERCPPQEQADPGGDQEERPQGPCPGDHVGREDALADEQGNRPEQDEEDAPAGQPAIEMHRGPLLVTARPATLHLTYPSSASAHRSRPARWGMATVA